MHKVIVSFLEGDPDQPIITGRAFNAISQVPYPLPANKTRTTIKTQTHKGEGSNELRFDDECDQEEVYIHAQKDLNTLVENDRSTHIKHDANLDVEHERFTRIKVNDHLTVEGDSRSVVKQDVSINIDPAGVHLVGPAVNLNSGGSAGAGSGYAGQLASLPGNVEAVLLPDAMAVVLPQINVEQQRKSIIEATVKGKPICVVCEETAS